MTPEEHIQALYRQIAILTEEAFPASLGYREAYKRIRLKAAELRLETANMEYALTEDLGRIHGSGLPDGQAGGV
jgi:hypothetical protein